MTTLFAPPPARISTRETPPADGPPEATQHEPDAMPEAQTPKKPTRRRATAESMAKKQRDISVSEFFAKNRHLLGFDNPRKAMLTTVKEAVDNALDACEEAGILADLFIGIEELAETRFRLTVRDNGPGIVRKQIDNIFGKLLYGSKFHRLKMSRGQQGIGISAAGMYGLMTTGKPVLIISKTGKRKPAHEVLLKIDTRKNRPVIVAEAEHPEDDQLFAEGHGTQIVIEFEGRYNKGRQSVDEYLEQTAIANPHTRIIYDPPVGDRVEFPRAVDELPPETKEIKPHPKGIELGTLITMLERTRATKLGGFLKDDFCRVGPRVAAEITKKAGLTPQSFVSRVGHVEAEKLYKAIQDTRIMAPPTDCLAPIGTKTLLAGLLKEVKAEFYAASSRSPTVYRGNPFLIEVGIAYGGDLPADKSAKVMRFANRVPLLYQQSGCAAFKSVVETAWRGYGLTQPRGALPVAPLVVVIHMASVWVPFTSESKEAVADYDEIRKEMRLALQECGRKLATYVRRRQRMKREGERRAAFERYIGEIAKACHDITGTDPAALYEALQKTATRRTAETDQLLDEEGKVISNGNGRLDHDDSVVIRDDLASPINGTDSGDGRDETLFGETRRAVWKKTKKKVRKKVKKKVTKKLRQNR
ncbi:MAG: DNA topoisomerase VI subunit B [Phycisphaerales bacterium]|nr:DNA topoisomerase VI subunit B [Phycisphaerales bacterium]